MDRRPAIVQGPIPKRIGVSGCNLCSLVVKIQESHQNEKVSFHESTTFDILRIQVLGRGRYCQRVCFDRAYRMS